MSISIRDVCLVVVQPNILLGLSTEKNLNAIHNLDVTKWLDFGKDHYATVCFSNTGDRVIAVPWMSNWQYANITPIRQNRGANALPRELSLYSKGGEVYMAANVVKEVEALRKETRKVDNFSLKGEQTISDVVAAEECAFEVEVDVTPGKSQTVGFDLVNDKGEKTKIYLDMKSGRKSLWTVLKVVWLLLVKSQNRTSRKIMIAVRQNRLIM